MAIHVKRRDFHSGSGLYKSARNDGKSHHAVRRVPRQFDVDVRICMCMICM